MPPHEREGGTTDERDGSGEPDRLRALGTRTSTSPSSVRILRSGTRSDLQARVRFFRTRSLSKSSPPSSSRQPVAALAKVYGNSGGVSHA